MYPECSCSFPSSLPGWEHFNTISTYNVGVGVRFSVAVDPQWGLRLRLRFRLTLGLGWGWVWVWLGSVGVEVGVMLKSVGVEVKVMLWLVVYVFGLC